MQQPEVGNVGRAELGDMATLLRKRSALRGQDFKNTVKDADQRIRSGNSYGWRDIRFVKRDHPGSSASQLGDFYPNFALE